MSELRDIFPTYIVRGALLRPDGVAVGLVSGGAPPWDLLSTNMRAQASNDYHRLLLAQQQPMSVYLVDYTLDLAGAISTLLERQALADSDLQAAILGEIAEQLTEQAQQSGSRAKQVIWAITSSSAGAERGVGGLDITRGLLGRSGGKQTTRSVRVGAVLAQAVESARRLADALAPLGGAPPPRLMESEEIARLVYQLADPVRAQRYPLSGALLDRVRRVTTT